MTLAKRNYYLLIDGSGSMDEPAGAGYSGTRWEAVEEVAISLAKKIAKSDPDGIDIAVFQGSRLRTFENQTDESSVRKIFDTMEPFSTTPLHLAVAYVVDHFVAQNSEVEPTFGIVLTDGAPNDGSLVVRELKRVGDFMKSKGLPDEMFTLWFIQVGDDPKGTAYLQMLDGDEKDTRVKQIVGYDLVDTTPITKLEGSIEDMVLKAIQD